MSLQPGSGGRPPQALPLPSPQRTSTGKVPSDDGSGEPTTILLVENERFVRQAAAQVLAAAGYNVLKARNAGEARRAIAGNAERIRLLIADVVLPGTSGCELWRELCAIRTEMRTIFVSGYPEITVTSTETDGVFYLAKPFTAECLLSKVRNAFATSTREETTQKMAAAASGV